MNWLKELFAQLFKRADNSAEVVDQPVAQKRAWLPEEVKFITKQYRKIGAAEVAWQLDRTEDSVRSKAKALGL